MHELSLCRSLYDIVLRAADGRRVEVVHLRVGRLRQVIPDTLVYCWDLTCADGPLSGARLEVESVPVRLTCADCGAQTPVEHALILVCGDCGSGQVRPIQGEEFLVTTIDVATEPVHDPDHTVPCGRHTAGPRAATEDGET